MIAGPHKLIGADGGFELYDLATDPGEKRDLADDHPELVAELALLLPSLADSPPRGGAPPLRLTSKMIQTLRALGYVEE